MDKEVNIGHGKPCLEEYLLGCLLIFFATATALFEDRIAPN